MYGRRGVFQFQCVVPAAEGKRAIYLLMHEIVRSRGASFLAVLKSMELRGQGMLSFPIPGFTLALDFPRRPETHGLLVRLHNIVLEYGGRIYLAKDACLSPEHFHAMYPEVERFKVVLRRVDPGGMFQSDMSRRLGLSAG
jgi:FAD/FMN-containing dehydrogenase